MTESQTESRKALRELIDFLSEADERWAGPEWNIESEADVVNAHRALMHLLEAGLLSYFEHEPQHPRFRRIVSPTRKHMGDNPDAINWDAPIRDDVAYRVRGRVDGAVYVSFTIEVDTHDGRMAQKTGGVLNDTQFDVDGEGRFELYLGGEPRERNWLALEPGASRITTRHYYENETPAAADAKRHAALEIEPLEPRPAPAAPTDRSVAAGIRRAIAFVRSRTLDQRPMAEAEPPPFVSILPNTFPAPVTPGDFGLAALDAAYSMAPFLLGPDDALVMTGRWPTCRMANVVLWNRHMQTFDYANRQISLNRAQTTLRPDGSFRMILAHRDPGLPNWIDTAGQAFGLVFWRFMLPEGPIETPRAERVPFASLVDDQ
ncbi:MAG: DUF1214 domain-containing protein [Deltaproteobacteria bacterium]|nr:DUF1214 domain-containing protein [Deltaproteobacteria bacterium]MBW2394773.1 DUF1214 domain-containing protein [Deltaproteobacteria bacterium]